MKESLHDRIRQRLEKLGLSPEAASKRAGLDRGYLQKLFERPNSYPRGDTLTKLAEVLDVSVSWLISGTESPASPQQGARTPEPPAPPRFDMPRDVPVMGTAAGSHMRGAFQIEPSVIDYVRRPPSLTSAKDIYALYVEGTSMEPQFNAGDLIYVHPHKPARVGDAIVVQVKTGEHEPVEATLGIFRKRTERHVTIGKHNPKADIDLTRDYVVAVHKVLTTNEIYGV